MRRTAITLPLLLSLLLVGAAPALGQRAPRPAARQKVILLVGMPGSGKTTAARRLETRLGAPRWTSGDVIRSTIAERGLPYNAVNDRKVAEEFARKPGEIGRRIAKQVKASGAQVAIVEGFRTTADLDAFAEAMGGPRTTSPAGGAARARSRAVDGKEFPQVKVVSLEVGADRRHQRMLARGRAGETTITYLKDRDRAETRRGVRDVMRRADTRLRPRGDDLSALDRSLRRMLRGIDPKLARRYGAAQGD